MVNKLEIPKKKLNFFCIFNKKEKSYSEVKYLNQHELSEGWKQIVPTYTDKRLLNYLNVTLCFLPEHLWSKIRKDSNNSEYTFRKIKEGVSRYTILETNQDTIMEKLYREVNRRNPNKTILNECIDNLDNNQYNSWLVIRARHIINHTVPYFQENITEMVA